MRDRERQRHRQREKQAPFREPDAELDPGTPGSRPGLKADAQPLRHPDVPESEALGAAGGPAICVFKSAEWLQWVLGLENCCIKAESRGAWVACSVMHLPLAQVMISGLWDQAPGPAPCSLCLCPSPHLFLLSSLSQINRQNLKNKLKKKK